MKPDPFHEIVDKLPGQIFDSVVTLLLTNWKLVLLVTAFCMVRHVGRSLYRFISTP